jgi:hypothetical protein
MMRPIRHWLLASSVALFAVLGCNSILDNQPGALLVTDQAGTAPEAGAPPLPTAQNDSSSGSGSGSDSGAGAVADAGDEPVPDCGPGQQMCNGSCVSLADPLFGCGNPSCAPCTSHHSTMGCVGRTCVVTACDVGFADCDDTPVDGCETDLSKATSCGACNAVCGAASPVCTAVGSSFECTNGCSAATPLRCGADCVDPNTSTSHCGRCDVTCPVVANGTEACVAGMCGLTCNLQFHACAGACVAQADPTACGPGCTACPVPAGGVATCVAAMCGVACTAPNHLCAGRCVAADDATACGAACTVCPARANAAATCAAGLCSFTCSAGFGNCDADAANGCEAILASDPPNCGACGKACAPPLTCVAGLCQ